MKVKNIKSNLKDKQLELELEGVKEKLIKLDVEGLIKNIEA